MIKKIGIIGLGTVGEATIKALLKFNSLIKKRTSLDVQIKKVCDVNARRKKVAARYKLAFTSNPRNILNDPDIDIVVELIGGIQPAKEYVLEALAHGKDIVTANKALLAECGKQIFSVAERLKRNIGFEASVCGAIPLIRSISEGLVGCQVRKLYGVVNGTTNYILCNMERNKMDFQSALMQATLKGFAEKHSDLDISGTDSLHKLAILSYLCFGAWPKLVNIHKEGIAKISLLDIVYAQDLSYTIKLLAIAKEENDGLDLRVHPVLISNEHPLSSIHAAYNAVWVDAYPAGELLFYGQGAGGIPTSSSVISDIVNISFARPRFIRERKKVRFKKMEKLTSRYYIRFMALDKPGVLAHISRILASYKISIASVTQKERQQKKLVPIVMITHVVKEKAMQQALSKINKLSMIKGAAQVIRIEDL